MKKVLFVLALVAAYGVSIAMTGPKTVTIDNAQVTIVADVSDDNVTTPEGDKEKEKTAKAKASKAKGEGCSSAKAEGCSDAKAKACSGKAKSDCGSSCAGKKK